MRRLSRSDTLVVATHNAGKLREISDLLAPYGMKAVSAGSLGLPVPEETETSFAGNARLKALAATSAAGLPALADDSGVCVEALGGDPGVYSADWAEPGKDFTRAMGRVNDLLTQKGALDAPARRAYFLSSLCLAWPDGHVEAIEGRVDGTIVWPPRGEGGFGYDPFFQPDGESRTFGEMSRNEKQALSHRARAFRLLAQNHLPES